MNLVVALPCEAKVLVSYYQLKKKCDVGVFALYQHPIKPLRLIVSGVGKVRAAAAVSYLAAQYPGQQSCYLNIGVAGSKVLAKGDCVGAMKIIDHVTGIAQYPFIARGSPTALVPVTTKDRPDTDYPEAGVQEMEAAGFFQVAAMYTDRECIASVKIVSDTPSHPLAALDKSAVATCIEGGLSEIDRWRLHLEATFTRVPEMTRAFTPEDPVFARFRCTWSEQQQLKELLRRWQLWLPHESFSTIVESAVTAKQLLKRLERHLAQASYLW